MSQVLELPKRRRKAQSPRTGKLPFPAADPTRNSAPGVLDPAEAEQLIAAAGASGRYQGRDQTLVMLMYRHGLRVSEAVSLRWEQVDLKAGPATRHAAQERRPIDPSTPRP